MAWAALIFWSSSQPHLPASPLWFDGADKLAHAGIYAVLTGTLLFGARWPRTSGQILIVALVATVYGGLDELHQYFVPPRTPDLWDLAADAIGSLAVAGVWLRLRARWPRASESGQLSQPVAAS